MVYSQLRSSLLGGVKPQFVEAPTFDHHNRLLLVEDLSLQSQPSMQREEEGREGANEPIVPVMGFVCS